MSAEVLDGERTRTLTGSYIGVDGVRQHINRIRPTRILYLTVSTLPEDREFCLEKDNGFQRDTDEIRGRDMDAER